ncbi:unnamed protein product [Didymodactylos carnosus]|uniref:Uncharacterized protein n=1 Tax=Didymodactylos carnosus TaxID=1234261 RepID=A0A8S2IU47_9BILA|nr:unnamed protein product [Didymodactylos carnosus]CAF3773872.1 unnamed protein product [Didymodactylos carnosus]
MEVYANHLRILVHALANTMEVYVNHLFAQLHASMVALAQLRILVHALANTMEVYVNRLFAQVHARMVARVQLRTLAHAPANTVEVYVNHELIARDILFKMRVNSKAGVTYKEMFNTQLISGRRRKKLIEAFGTSKNKKDKVDPVQRFAAAVSNDEKLKILKEYGINYPIIDFFTAASLLKSVQEEPAYALLDEADKLLIDNCIFDDQTSRTNAMTYDCSALMMQMFNSVSVYVKKLEEDNILFNSKLTFFARKTDYDDWLKTHLLKARNHVYRHVTQIQHLEMAGFIAQQYLQKHGSFDAGVADKKLYLVIEQLTEAHFFTPQNND